MPSYRMAAPCSADWDAMLGDDRVRHCPQCHLDVYNFSAMTPPEIAQLVRDRTGRLCARFYQRVDGTMLTRDCPIGAPTPVSNPSLLATAALAALVSIAPARVAGAPQSPTVTPAVAKLTEPVLSLVVRDPAGGGVPHSVIVLVNAKTGERFEAKTDELGQFSTSVLSPGTYDLTVTSPGFFSFSKKSITTPAAATITINLQLGLMGEVVVVGPEPSTIEELSAGSAERLSPPENAPLKPSNHPNALQRLLSKLHRVFQ